MDIWAIIMVFAAAIVCGIDFLLRRKKWNDNTKEEKVSLLVNLFSTGPYIFLSALGVFWGLVTSIPDTGFGEAVYNVTLWMGGTYAFVALAAVIASLILRKLGKVKASIWINVIAVAYIIVVLAVNALVGYVF